MKRALVCGAGGFIGGHLAEFLKEKGYWVRGVDIKLPEFRDVDFVDDFKILDLRRLQNCFHALNIDGETQFDEVYQLAADMGGMGFIENFETDIVINNALINMHMTEASVKYFKVKKYFYSSSACIYKNMEEGDLTIDESDAYPAMPHNEYGWEKLYSERVLKTFGRKYPETETYIARFENTYGPFGTYDGGREKAPAAICRKVAKANKKDEIEVWGDGTALRSYIYVKDLVEAIYVLTNSGFQEPVNIGIEEIVTVNQLVNIVSEVADKTISKKYIEGNVGVKNRDLSHALMKALGWEAKYSLRDGIKETYPWILEQINNESLNLTENDL
jgi:GDP-D-mannose 3',5'-epimerase